MEYKFRIVAGSMEVLESFLREKPAGISISHESAHKPAREPSMTYDSAEDILRFIVSAARDIDVSLFSVWLYEVVSRPSRRKTTVNGLPVPESQAELAALIVKLINEQKQDAESAPPKQDA